MISWLKHINLVLVFCALSLSLSAQETIETENSNTISLSEIYKLMQRADSLCKSYDFPKAVGLYTEALESAQDSALRVSIDELMSLAQNGENMSGYCDQPVVVARQKFSLKDFFLFYPLKDASWRPAPNQLDSIGGKFSEAVYFPSNSEKIYYSAQDDENIRNIYFTEYQDTVWAAPALLNEHTTSSANEIYPMLSPDGKSLYFSSAGLYGMGGYDLYVSTLNPETREWGTPVNLGFPYSSPYDDFLYVNSDDGRYSLFASNRLCGADSVYIYVLEYDPMPVRKAVTKPEDLRKLTALAPVDDPSRVDNGAAVEDIADNVDTRRYVEKMTVVRELRDSIDAYNSSIDQARARWSGAEESAKSEIAAWIKEREEALPMLQNALGQAVKELQAVEMEFLMSGVVIDPGKIQSEADREVVGVESGYVFSKRSMGKNVEMNILKPKAVFDYSLQLLEEGRFAEDQTLPEGLIYQIQLFSSSARPSVKQLKGLSPVFSHKASSGKYISCVGLFKSYKDVLANLNKVKKAGFPGAFIVAYKDGAAVSVAKARELENSIKYLYLVRIYGESLSQEASAAIRAVTQHDIAKSDKDGILSFIVGPFDDKAEAEALVGALKMVGVQSVSLESAETAE